MHSKRTIRLAVPKGRKMNAYEPLAFGGRVQYVEPRYKREQVNAAGRALIAPAPPGPVTVEYFEGQIAAYEVVNNWRASHHRPLNTFAITLKNRAKQIAGSVIVAQRIKRLDSITKKLSAQEFMKLSQMQDIAGCRAVMPNIASVRQLEKTYRSAGFSHEMKPGKDYITNPKASGYRGVHLVYRYKLREPSPHEGQQIEIQIRTQLQHTWATAVEAAGTFTNQALKSSQGSEQWRRFFSLMGSWIAHLENCPLVPETPTDMVRLKHEVRVLAASLHVVGILRTYTATLQQVGKVAKMKYYLMDLDPDQQNVRLTGFTAAQTKEANDSYTQTEKNMPMDSNRQVVLVSVDSLQALRQAYPNYFLDTTKFVSLVENVIAQPPDVLEIDDE